MTTNTPTPEVSPVHEGKPKKSGLIWLILFIAVAGVAGYAVYRANQPGQIIVSSRGGRGGSGGRGGGRGAGLGPVPVVINKVKRADVPQYDPALGNVTPYNTVTLHTLVNGEIMAIHFQEGDMVKKGQVLFDIDQRPYKVVLEQAEGQLARDQAQLADAQLDMKRYATLLQQNAIPVQQQDTQKALVGQLEGTVKTDQANIDSAKLNLVYTEVTAPFDGRIGLRLVDPGNIVHTSDAGGLLVIAQVQPIAVDFTIAQDWLPPVLKRLRAGVKLPVEAWNRDNSQRLETGYLLTLDNQIDPTTGTAKLKAVFANKDEQLFPSQFVNIKLLVDTQRNQIVIPSVAVQNGQQGAFVYVVNGSRVELRPVTTGINLETTVQILSGLEDGEQVVVDGTDRLQNGSQVRVRQPGGGDAGGGRGSRGGHGGSGAHGSSGHRAGGGSQADVSGVADAQEGDGSGRGSGPHGGSGRGRRGGGGSR